MRNQIAPLRPGTGTGLRLPVSLDKAELSKPSVISPPSLPDFSSGIGRSQCLSSCSLKSLDQSCVQERQAGSEVTCSPVRVLSTTNAEH